MACVHSAGAGHVCVGKLGETDARRIAAVAPASGRGLVAYQVRHCVAVTPSDSGRVSKGSVRGPAECEPYAAQVGQHSRGGEQAGQDQNAVQIRGLG